MHLLHGSIVSVNHCATAAFAYFDPQARPNTSAHRNTRYRPMALSTHITAQHGSIFARMTAAIEGYKAGFAQIPRLSHDAE